MYSINISSTIIIISLFSGWERYTELPGVLTVRMKKNNDTVAHVDSLGECASMGISQGSYFSLDSTSQCVVGGQFVLDVEGATTYVESCEH